VTAIAERRDDLTDLVSNANVALGAIADQNTAFDASLRELPPTLRQANTTFVNLRATLDDLDPLVNTSKRATKDLEPFLKKLRPVARRAVPVFGDLARAALLPGPNNDLGELVKDLVPLHRRGAPASRSGIRALNASQPTITFARPYGPDLFGSLSKLGAVSGYYDGDGNYARVQAAAFNLFRYNSVTTNLDPIPPSEKFDGFDFRISTRCPGGATQPIAGSNPFLDQGRLVGKCDPADVPPGP
jgi:phospholipid/cholesterol/gamma-HCH transport system substrate-binding protein